MFFNKIISCINALSIITLIEITEFIFVFLFIIIDILKYSSILDLFSFSFLLNIIVESIKIINI